MPTHKSPPCSLQHRRSNTKNSKKKTGRCCRPPGRAVEPGARVCEAMVRIGARVSAKHHPQHVVDEESMECFKRMDHRHCCGWSCRASCASLLACRLCDPALRGGLQIAIEVRGASRYSWLVA